MKSIGKNFLFNLILTLSNILFPLITFPYVARVLGPSGIGASQFVISFAQYFVLICSLGIPLYGVKAIARVKNDPIARQKVFSEIFSINVYTTILVSIAYLLIVGNFSFFKNEIYLYLIAFVNVVTAFLCVDWYYMGNENFKVISIRSVFIKLIAVVLLFMLVKEPSDINYYVFFSVFIFSLGNIINGLLIPGVKLRLVTTNLKVHLNKLLLIFATTIAISVYTVLDTIFLGFLSTKEAVGFYTAGLKINKVLIPVVISLGAVLIPRMAELFLNEKKDEINSLTQKSFDFLCLLSIPIMFGIFCYAPDLMLLFSGEKFMDATAIMRLTSPLIVLVGFGHLFGLQLLITSNREKKYFYGVLLAMGANLILQFLLLPRFNAMGAGIVIVLTELIVTGVAFYYVYHDLGIRLNYKSALTAVLSSIPIALLAWMYHESQFTSVWSLMLIISMCVVSYFGLILFLFKDPFCLDLIAKNYIWKRKKY